MARTKTFSNGGSLLPGDLNSLQDQIWPWASGFSGYFRAWRSGAVSYASAATLVFDTETDPNGWYNTTTGIFQPTVAGMYRVSWLATTGSLGANKAIWTALMDAGSVIVGSSGGVFQVTFAQGVAAGGTALVPMNGSTDALHVAVSHDNGGSLALVTGVGLTHFEANWAGA